MTTAGMTAANPIGHETLRRSDLGQLSELITSQRLRTVDVAATGRNLWIANGNLIIQGMAPHQDLTDEGVTTIDLNGTYAFGDIGVESLAARTGVPSSWLREQHANHPDLFDDVAGYVLRGERNGEPSPHTTPDNRLHTIRLLRADTNVEGNEVDGMVRAVLGGNYLAIDHTDILAAVAEGMGLAGVQPGTFKVEADLTESRMVVKVWMPDLWALAPAVFKGYRSPFSGGTVDDMPKVFAGLVFSNSEVGRGAWSVAPRIVFEACGNGTNITKDVFDKRHVGERLDSDGVIKWSQRTQQLSLDLIISKTADYVRTYLDVDYLKATLAEMAKDATAPTGTDPEQTIMKVTRHTGHTAARTAILNMFIQGGDNTAGGVMQAYTAAAQTMASAETAYDLENRAVDAMVWTANRNR